MRIMEKVIQDVKAEYTDLVGPISILGVQAFQADAGLIRTTEECKPMTHFSVRGQVKHKLKEAFDRAGIDIPVPQRAVEIRAHGLLTPTNASQEGDF